MKTLYLDCGMGAAGDMLTAALLELLPNPDEYIEKLNSLGIPDVKFSLEKSVKCGIGGTHISVKIGEAEESEELHLHEHTGEHTHAHTHHHHHHSDMHTIEHIVKDLNLPKKIENDIIAVYNLIAEAESYVHKTPVTEIHFHEVGTMDAVADITAVCLLMNEISPEKVIVSPIHVGIGHVKCAHGILPVPAPATAYILKDVPIYGGEIEGELCTPTGAALIKHFATEFGNMPVMTPKAIGYGMGKKDFAYANCLRAVLGVTKDLNDVIVELSCNVDDMTAEEISFSMDRLFECGALEVYTESIGMKKSRPGTLIRVMCNEQEKGKMVNSIFKYTTTIGVRESVMRRYVMERNTKVIKTPYGEIRQKISSGYGVSRSKYEYDDLARIAKEQNISIAELKNLIED